MAQRIFKNMTPEQRREARKQSRLKKQKPAAPAPRFSGTNRGKRDAAEKREAAFVEQKKGAQPSLEQEAATRAASTKFEDIFLNIVQFLPPEQQARAFSLFSVFRQLPEADQKSTIDSLMQVAREQTGPLFDLYKKRIEEDTDYQKADLDRQKNNAKANYDRLVAVTDFNALHDKAKTDRNIAKIIRNITNTAFVDRVSGSGIQRRRTQEQLEEARLAKEEIDIDKTQKQGSAGQAYGQIAQEIDQKLNREDALGQRLLDDNEQKRAEEERALFLQLFDNNYSMAGDVARDNLESGDIPTTSGGRAGSDISILPGGVKDVNVRRSDSIRADVFNDGGTDDQRRTRGNEEKRVKNATAEQARLEKLVSDTDQAVNYLFNLNRYKKALQLAGRNTADVDAEMARIMPVASARLDRARHNEGSFRGQSGSGLPDDLRWYLDRDAEEYVFDRAKLIGKYGTSPLDRTKLASELQQFSAQYNSNTFGTLYKDLDKEWEQGGVYIPGSNEFNNKYGSLNFNESLRGPVPVPTSSLMNPRVDVLAPNVTVAPNSNVRAPVRLTPGTPQAGWTDGLTNKQQIKVLGDARAGRTQPTVVTNPMTGKTYTGAAAERLQKRLR